MMYTFLVLKISIIISIVNTVCLKYNEEKNSMTIRIMTNVGIKSWMVFQGLSCHVKTFNLNMWVIHGQQIYLE